ncbi:hypothetical protein SBRCBS47491_007091 [Sporothrix bragantina]|uniref:C2 NT-type domain-containing protein n=1 Tax=Sporothrix bragantina TaxID=671064 RepID=A0ABP0CBX7_9PEZI
MADDEDGLDFNVDIVAQGDTSAFHVPNLPGEDFRKVLAQTTSQKSPLNMRIKIVEVHHGTMIYEEEECPATLLIFEFRFQSSLHGHRYEMVEVKLEFCDKGNNRRRDPVVVKLAPDRMHWLNKTTYDQRTKLNTSAGLSGGSTGLASADAKISWEMEQTKQLKFKSTLTGNPARSDGNVGDIENAVVWKMEENPAEADGVPSFLQTAVLLKRTNNAPFIGKLSMSSRVDFKSAGSRLRSATSDKDKIIDPVAFDPSKSQVRNNKVSGITPAELESMDLIDLTKMFRVNLSEQDDLTPGTASAVGATKEEEGAADAAAPEVATNGEDNGSAFHTLMPQVGLSIGKGEGAEDDDNGDGGDGGDGSDDTGAATTALPTPSFSFHSKQTMTRTTAGGASSQGATAAPAVAPAPALERKLPVPDAPAALATPAASQGPSSLSGVPSTSALPPALVAETVASAVQATQLAAQAAVAVAEAAKQAAEAATAASRAAEAAVQLLNRLGLQ